MKKPSPRWEVRTLERATAPRILIERGALPLVEVNLPADLTTRAEVIGRRLRLAEAICSLLNGDLVQ